MPTLLIAGGEDVVFPPFLASAIATTLPCGEAQLIPAAGHSPYFEQAATFNAWSRRFWRATGRQPTRLKEETRVQGQSADRRAQLRHRVQSLLAGHHRGGLRDRRRYPRQPDRERGALGRLDHPARPARLLHRDGSHGTMDAGAAARLAGPARRPGRGRLLQEFRRRDRGRPEGRIAARRRLRIGPWRGSGRGHGRSRRRSVRGGPPRRRSGHPGRRDVRPARQRLAQDDRQSLGVRGLSREPAHRHLRARRRGRQAHARVPGRRAHRHHHGQGAAGAAADLAADRAGAPTPT